MTSANKNQETGNKHFKQVEADGWLSNYLPAISAGVVMTVVLLLAISCSQKSDKRQVKIDPPASATAAPPIEAQAPVALPEPPKHIKKLRPQNATYVNSEYGVRFSYPRKYGLEAGDRSSSMPVEPAFLKSGALEVASLNMPGDRYEETDFSSALLNVAVNPQITAAECAQFKAATSDPDRGKPATVKLGSNKFTELEVSDKKADRESAVKYFHVFKNAACYEFALDVETGGKPSANLTPLDRDKVFAQLEKILSTATIREVELPGMEQAKEASGSGTEQASQSLVPDHK